MAAINVIQPYYDADPEVREELVNQFWANVDGDPACVVVVAAYDASEGSVILRGVFSTRTKAMDFAANHEDALVVPKRLDEPGWGNMESH